MLPAAREGAGKGSSRWVGTDPAWATVASLLIPEEPVLILAPSPGVTLILASGMLPFAYFLLSPSSPLLPTAARTADRGDGVVPVAHPARSSARGCDGGAGGRGGEAAGLLRPQQVPAAGRAGPGSCPLVAEPLLSRCAPGMGAAPRSAAGRPACPSGELSRLSRLWGLLFGSPRLARIDFKVRSERFWIATHLMHS